MVNVTQNRREARVYRGVPRPAVAATPTHVQGARRTPSASPAHAPHRPRPHGQGLSARLSRRLAAACAAGLIAGRTGAAGQSGGARVAPVPTSGPPPQRGRSHNAGGCIARSVGGRRAGLKRRHPRQRHRSAPRSSESSITPGVTRSTLMTHVSQVRPRAAREAPPVAPPSAADFGVECTPQSR